MISVPMRKLYVYVYCKTHNGQNLFKPRRQTPVLEKVGRDGGLIRGGPMPLMVQTTKTELPPPQINAQGPSTAPGPNQRSAKGQKDRASQRATARSFGGVKVFVCSVGSRKSPAAHPRVSRWNRGRVIPVTHPKAHRGPSI